MMQNSGIFSSPVAYGQVAQIAGAGRVGDHYHFVFKSARQKLKALLGVMLAYAATQKVACG